MRLFLAFIFLASACTAGADPEPQATEPRESPAWQVPIVLDTTDRILDYGAIEYDNRERDVIVRLAFGTPFGPDVIHGPITATVPLGEATIAAIPASPIDIPHAPLLIQVWRPNIAINNGRLIGVWVRSERQGIVHYSAISGRGAGEIDYMQSYVKWLGP